MIPISLIFTNFHQFSPIFVNFHQFSSIFTNFHGILSTGSTRQFRKYIYNKQQKEKEKRVKGNDSEDTEDTGKATKVEISDNATVDKETSNDMRQLKNNAPKVVNKTDR